MDDRLVRLLTLGVPVVAAVDYLAVELDETPIDEWIATRPEAVTEAIIVESIDTVRTTLTPGQLAEFEGTSTSFPCEECGEDFDNKGALGSHVRHRHEREYDPNDPSSMTLNPDTRRFRVASAIFYAPDAVRPREVETVLADTAWEMDRVNISAELHDLHDHGAVTRTKQTDERGQPYTYRLTSSGKARVERAIDSARQDGLPTFDTL